MVSGNFRLGEFAGAVLNCQLDRLREQVDHRDANARYLDARLSQIPGITPQRRDAFVTKNSVHLYLFRFDESVFGITRARFLEALAAEGIPVAPGYVIPLYRQPLFADKAFGPYSGAMDADYASVRLPVCERLSNLEGAWLYQSVLLGSRQDMDDVVNAVAKIYEHRKALSSAKPQAAGVAR
jgi:dTDP-4-amino-4,6-dideoxygalactose transaminase